MERRHATPDRQRKSDPCDLPILIKALVQAAAPAAAILLATALATPLVAQTAVTAALSLGTPVSQGNGQYTIPVNILTSPDSAPPQAFCFRVATSAPVAEMSIAHAGVCDGVRASFEWQTSSASSASYVIVYDERSLRLPTGTAVTAAELHITLQDPLFPVRIDFDPTAPTMISNQGGTISATPAKGNLSLGAGVTIDPLAPPPATSKRRVGGH